MIRKQHHLQGVAMGMKSAVSAICISLALLFGPSRAQAMEGAFDRSAEADAFIEMLNTSTKGQITAAFDQLYWSGISNRQLADKLHEMLLRDMMDIPNPSGTPPVPRFSWTYEESYGVAIVLASRRWA